MAAEAAEDRDRGVDDAAEAREVLAVCRRSHERLSGLVEPLDDPGLERGSYCTDWTIAAVLSHLGSQSEIFDLFAEAALSGGESPSQDDFRPIWDSWDAKPPAAKRSDSRAANDRLLRRIEGLGDEQLASLRIKMFGLDVGVAGLLRMRLSEHAVHTWDVAVALDPGVEIAADAVETMIDKLPDMVARVGQKADRPTTVAITTGRPERHFVLETGGVELRPARGDKAAASIELGAEALIRLVYGRLEDAGLSRDAVHANGVSLDQLQAVFPGV